MNKNIKMGREPIGKSLRFRIFERDDFMCQYCGRNPTEHNIALELDHCISVKNGGTNEEDNLITSCFDCNRGKSKKSVIINKDKKVSDIEDDLQKIKERLTQVKYIKNLRKKIIQTKNIILEEKFYFVRDILGGYSDKFRSEVRRAVESQHRKGVGLDILEECVEIAYEKFRYDEFYTRDFIKYFYGILRNKIQTNG